MGASWEKQMHLTGEKGGGRKGIKEKVIEYMLHESRRKDCLRAEMEPPRVITKNMCGKEDI